MNLKKLIANEPEEVVSVACGMMVADGGRQGLSKYIEYTEQMVMEADEWLDTLESTKRKNASKASPKSEASSTTTLPPGKLGAAPATTQPLKNTT